MCAAARRAVSISWWRVSGCASCLDVGAAETEAFWRESSGAWSRAACSACSLVISDAHPGLKAALAQVLGAPSQQCTVHVLRDLRSHVRKDQHDALDAIIRTIVTAADGDRARERLRDAVVHPRDRSLPTKRRAAVRTEWRLITATHDLLKLQRHTVATA